MDHPILNYVGARVPPERMALYLECHQLLVDYYPDGWYGLLDQMLTQIEDREQADIETMVHEALINNLKSMVQECNIDFHPHFDFYHELRQLYELTCAIYTLEQYQNMVALQLRFDAYTDAAEQVAAVFQEVRPSFDADTFYSMINHISPTFITRLRAILEDTIEHIEPMLESQPQVAIIGSTLAAYGKEFPALLEIPFSHVGGTLDAYIDRYRTQIESLPPPAAVRLLLLCALLAKLDEEQGRPALGNVIQSVFQHDVRRAMTCGRMLNAMAYPRADA